MMGHSKLILYWHTLIPVVVLLLCVIVTIKERDK